MNDLQLAIVGIGAALIAGIWGHWKWQEFRHRKVAQRLLDPTQGDALFARPTGELPVVARSGKKKDEPAVAERREPVIEIADPDDESDEASQFVPELTETASIGGGSGGVFAAPPSAVQSHEAVPADTSKPSTSRPLNEPTAPTSGEPPVALLSPEIDFVATFELAEAQSGQSLLAVSREGLPTLKKRIAWVGFDETGGSSRGRWEALRPGGQYRNLRVGIQLADRAGPLSPGMLEQFRRSMERIADELTAVAEMPATREALARAAKLDRVCAEVDVQMTVNVIPRHPPFSLDAIRKAALAVGFRLGSDGMLSYDDAGGQRLFVLQSSSGVQEGALTFVYEVPCVTHGDVAFDRMMRVAKEFSEVVDGLLVDDQKRPVTDRFVGPVREQIRDLQARMAAQGIKAGSEIALRLFA
jgi:hypothetical protein